MRYDVVLARYGELGLKSRPVRRRFEQALQENIERAFEAEALDGVVTRIPGRFLITTTDPGRGVAILSRIFGLTSASPARIVTSELEPMLAALREFFDEVAATKPDAKTFAVRVRRSGQHPYSSQDVARAAGGAVLDRPEGARWKVNLTAPDIEVFLEIRDKRAYLFHGRTDGPGGLPMGTQGKVVVLLKDLDSALAAWMMMKRGCTVLPVAFLGPTGNVDRSRDGVELLRRWYFRGSLIEVPHGEASDFPRRAACVLCMRQMIRKADLIARRKKAKAIVTGETFASTTVESLPQFGGLAHVPVLRPLLGMTPPLVAEFAQRLGLSVGRGATLQEPCPYRVPGKLDEAAVREAESELGLEVRAHEAVRTHVSASVTP